MQAEILDNQQKTLLAYLGEALPQSQSLAIAVAFVKYSGLRLLYDGITELLARDGSFEIVFGLDFVLTEPKAIRELLAILRAYPNSVVCRAYADYRLRDIPNFHPKLYILEGSADAINVTVGSSNLTAGGLQGNVELNMALAVSKDDPIAMYVGQTFLRLKTQNAAFLPDDEYLLGYESTYKALQRKGREAARDPGVQQVVSHLKQLERPLRRASKTQLGVCPSNSPGQL